mgnify:CR=1 FL=1
MPLAGSCDRITRSGAAGRRPRRRGPRGPTRTWNFVKEALTLRAIGLFSEYSWITWVAIFLSSRRTGAGNCTSSTLSLNSVLSRSSAMAFLAWKSMSPWTWVATAARSRIRRRSAGRLSYAFLLKPNSLTVPGSCQPG